MIQIEHIEGIVSQVAVFGFGEKKEKKRITDRNT